MLIDAVDRRILALLRENARMSTALLGRQLGVSRTTVHSRIERLLARRVITGFTVRMGADQERDQIQAQVMIAAVQKVLARVEAALRALPEVRKLLGQRPARIHRDRGHGFGRGDGPAPRSDRDHRGRRSHRILDRALDTDRSLAQGFRPACGTRAARPRPVRADR